MSQLIHKFTPPLAALLLSAALIPLQAQTSTAAGVTITVTSSSNPSTFAAPVTFTIVVAAPTAAGPVPTGTIAATLLGPIQIGAATLDGSGKAVITVPAQPSPLATSPWGLPAGSNTIAFSYSGDTKYKAAQSSFIQFVKRADTATTAAVIGSSQPLQLSATVKIDEASVSATAFSLPGNLSSSSPTGSVQFFNGSTLLGTAVLSPSGLFTSTATLPAVTTPASLTAVYAGDSNYDGSISTTVGGGGKGTAKLTITSSVNPSTFAQQVIFTIAATPASSGGPSPTGTVTASLLGLFDLGKTVLDANGLGSITVPSSSTSSIPWGLPAGSDDITFSYSGDANYSPAKTDFTQTVNTAATTTAAAFAPSATSITATVSIDEPSVSQTGFALPGQNPATSSPTGAVTFMSGSAVFGTAPLVPNGHFQSAATLTIPPTFAPLGNLVAVYNGDANYKGSTSPPVTIPTLVAVTVGVSSSVNPATFAQPVTLSIKVAPATAGNVIPTGTVQASLQGSDILGTATLDSTGGASITVPSQNPSASAVLPWGLATGSNVITVTYSGDSTFATGQAKLNQLVNQADTSILLIPAPEAIGSNSITVLTRVSINEPSVSQTGFRIPAGGNLSTSPTGNVDFFDGSKLLGTVKLIPGPAFDSTVSFTATPRPASIRAVYHGDTNYNGSTSQTTTLGNGNGTVTITLTSSANPTTYGAAFTILATVTPSNSGGPTPTGTLQFFDGAQNLGWIATLDSSGRGTLQVPIPLATAQFCVFTCPPAAYVEVLGAGSHTITAQYSGDAIYAATTSASSVAQQITKAPTKTSIAEFAVALGLPSASSIVATVADAQPPSGGPYRFMVLSGNGLTDGNPTGKVQFFSGTTLIGTAALTPNSADNVTSKAGIDNPNMAPNVSATYAGDANFQGSSSPTSPGTTVSLAATPNPSTTGQSVTLTATIATPSATTAPTGKVEFLDGKTLLGSATVSGGTATLTTAFTTAGSHSLTAIYSGDANYLGATSAVYTQVVNLSTTPTDTLKLTVSNTTAVFGRHIVLFAQVIGNVNTPPTGTVSFLDGSTVIGNGTLSFGYAFAVVTLGVGSHQISASWAGDSNWPAAKSAVVTVTVDKAPTDTLLWHFGTAWTAVVMAEPPGGGSPTGSVQFIDTVTQAVLATATLSNGTATAVLSSVSDPVQAVYSGDANFEASKSRMNSTPPPHTHR